MTRAERIYKVYKSAVNRKFIRVPRYELNALYNAECRIKKDSKYARELAEYETAEGDSIASLIEKYFYDYNNRYGLEIRDDLIEYENPDMACGSFFIIESFRKDSSGNLSECLPTEFTAGDSVHIKATLISHETKTPITAKNLTATVVTDDGEEIKTTVRDSDFIAFDLTLSRPGSLKFKVLVLGDDEEPMLGAETAYGGIVFSRKEIKTTHEVPSDLKSFWTHEVKRMLAVNPCEAFADGYSGKVETEFDISERNRYKLVKLDGEYVSRLTSLGQPTPTEEELLSFDIYELNLKAPGPCPTTAFLTIPKSAEAKSLPIHFIFDGYGVKMPSVVCVSGQISVHLTHHGYELCRSKEYYQQLWNTVCGNYCRGNGEVNSDFADIHDCYPLYLLLRNLQALRYLTDEKLSSDIENLHSAFCGEVIMSGGSMGGFQTIGVGALASILRDLVGGFKLTSLSAPSPAFGNVAGSTDRRVTSTFFVYAEGADYFDTAMMATMLDTPTDIPRASLGDEACPITTITAIYNSIPENVRGEIRYIQNSSHGYLPDEEYQRWIVYKQ